MSVTGVVDTTDGLAIGDELVESNVAGASVMDGFEIGGGVVCLFTAVVDAMGAGGENTAGVGTADMVEVARDDEVTICVVDVALVVGRLVGSIFKLGGSGFLLEDGENKVGVSTFVGSAANKLSLGVLGLTAGGVSGILGAIVLSVESLGVDSSSV